MTVDELKPRIPRTEYPQRWRTVQSFMAQQGLDLLIAYADDRATYGAAHARWLADFPVHFESMCVLLRQEGDPILFAVPKAMNTRVWLEAFLMCVSFASLPTQMKNTSIR